MAYQIEVLAINEDLYENIRQACDTLNRIQTDFHFFIPKPALRSFLFIERSQKYYTLDIWKWLKRYLDYAKGNRFGSILVVDGQLESDEYSNLFGSSRADEGLATFTVAHLPQFINDITRYCKYYLVRYAIGFIQPSVKSHEDRDPEKIRCLFHKKINKNELEFSLTKGHLCEDCKKQLRPKLTFDIYKSIEDLIAIATNQKPYSLIIKGGGVKGLAFAGALSELEKHFSFDTFAGTSAGAIAALFLGAGYEPRELMVILSEKDFKDFKDANWFGARINFLRTGGLYPGNTIEQWIQDTLSSKFPDRQQEIYMENLPHHTILYATRAGRGSIPFDSKGRGKDTSAVFAARCSMSIPFFFSPKSIEDKHAFDGGVRNNFPLQIFMNTYPNKQYIGLYLTSSKGKTKLTWRQKGKKIIFKALKVMIPGLRKATSITGELLDIVVDGDEKRIVDENRGKIVIIDPSPIDTTDFNLTNAKKQLLIAAGRLGALKFMQKYYNHIEIDPRSIEQLEQQINTLRKAV